MDGKQWERGRKRRWNTSKKRKMERKMRRSSLIVISTNNRNNRNNSNNNSTESSVSGPDCPNAILVLTLISKKCVGASLLGASQTSNPHRNPLDSSVCVCVHFPRSTALPWFDSLIDFSVCHFRRNNVSSSDRVLLTWIKLIKSLASVQDVIGHWIIQWYLAPVFAYRRRRPICIWIACMKRHCAFPNRIGSRKCRCSAGNVCPKIKEKKLRKERKKKLRKKERRHRRRRPIVNSPQTSEIESIWTYRGRRNSSAQNSAPTQVAGCRCKHIDTQHHLSIAAQSKHPTQPSSSRDGGYSLIATQLYQCYRPFPLKTNPPPPASTLQKFIKKQIKIKKKRKRKRKKRGEKEIELLRWNAFWLKRFQDPARTIDWCNYFPSVLKRGQLVWILKRKKWASAIDSFSKSDSPAGMNTHTHTQTDSISDIMAACPPGGGYSTNLSFRFQEWNWHLARTIQLQQGVSSIEFIFSFFLSFFLRF